MKLKTAFQDENFKLGEVADVSMATIPNGRIVARATAKVGGEHTFYYDSLEAVYNDWKDYEEPKDHWYVNYQGEVYVLDPSAVPEYSKNAKEIGNYFETREEAEKAVEKLKAWKRLKDRNLRFNLNYSTSAATINHKDVITGRIEAYFDDKWEEDNMKAEEDLYLLLGGEE